MGSFSTYLEAAAAFLEKYSDQMAAQSGLSRKRPVTKKTVARWMSQGVKADKGPPTFG